MKVFFGPSMQPYAIYMLQILSYAFQEEVTAGNFMESEILCEEIGDQMRYIYLKPWKYSFLHSAEPFHHEPRPYTMVFCGNDEQVGEDKEKCVLLPYFFFAYDEYRAFENRTIPQEVPPKFACAFVSHPYNTFRNQFLQSLVDLKMCDSYGKVANNMGTFEGNHVEKMKEYMFNICFENSVHEAYITEKMPNALQAGVIPVYMGAPTVCNYFNKNRFLFLENTSEEAIVELIQKMVFISRNPDLYLWMVKQPILPEGGTCISLKSLGSQVRAYLLKKGLLTPAPPDPHPGQEAPSDSQAS